jgi:hypothetical protein
MAPVGEVPVDRPVDPVGALGLLLADQADGPQCVDPGEVV